MGIQILDILKIFGGGTSLDKTLEAYDGRQKKKHYAPRNGSMM